MILAVLGLYAVVTWIAGPEAGTTAMIMISIGLGAYFAVGWGGDYATKVEGYRQELIGKKGQDSQPNAVPQESDDEDDDPSQRGAT
ncbi:hypothetical protein [Arthrobacter sp. ISL-69]|uniref:hypothetical protein n=1 Tax=Arthrobacter sp. ISL-69 TaxID=2819113 RepID=UPI001BE83271|nr:hypothetical protein [Arthrobacter sp. ISL-69]